MPNFASIINPHNKKIINSNILKPPTPTCSCRLKTSCPLNGDFLQSSFIYICKTDTPDIIENHTHYIGLTEHPFKDQFYEHKNSFNYESKHNPTKLSSFVWKKQHANTETNLVWNELDKARAYRPEAKRCLLCLKDKHQIILSKLNLLNSRNELVTKCCHENKFDVANFKDTIT